MWCFPRWCFPRWCFPRHSMTQKVTIWNHFTSFHGFGDPSSMGLPRDPTNVASFGGPIFWPTKASAWRWPQHQCLKQLTKSSTCWWKLWLTWSTGYIPLVSQFSLHPLIVFLAFESCPSSSTESPRHAARAESEISRACCSRMFDPWMMLPLLPFKTCFTTILSEVWVVLKWGVRISVKMAEIGREKTCAQVKCAWGFLVGSPTSHA